MNGSPIRVVIADDSYLVRAGIARALAESGEAEVVAEADDLDSLGRAVGEAEPDVVVTDIRMPPTKTDEGVAFALELGRTHPQIGVVVLSQYAQLSYARSLFADGNEKRAYILKDRVADSEFLLEVVRSVSKGIPQLDSMIVSLLLEPEQGADSRLRLLSDREREVLELVATGATNAAVAKKLVLTPRAVERHVNAIFEKLDLPDGPDANRRVLAAVAYAERVER